jgi:hypothetical protein
MGTSSCNVAIEDFFKFEVDTSISMNYAKNDKNMKLSFPAGAGPPKNQLAGSKLGKFPLGLWA